MKASPPSIPSDQHGLAAPREVLILVSLAEIIHRFFGRIRNKRTLQETVPCGAHIQPRLSRVTCVLRAPDVPDVPGLSDVQDVQDVQDVPDLFDVPRAAFSRSAVAVPG